LATSAIQSTRRYDMSAGGVGVGQQASLIAPFETL